MHASIHTYIYTCLHMGSSPGATVALKSVFLKSLKMKVSELGTGWEQVTDMDPSATRGSQCG